MISRRALGGARAMTINEMIIHSIKEKTTEAAVREAKFAVSPVKLKRDFNDCESDRKIIFNTIENFYAELMQKMHLEDVKEEIKNLTGDVYLIALNEIRNYYAIDTNRS